MGALKAKFKEVTVSVLPICALMALLAFTIAPIGAQLMIRFFAGAALLIAGLTLFLFGTELGMQPMGERIGASLTRSRSIPLIAGAAFFLGVLITMAEPDLHVLAGEVSAVSGGHVQKLALVASVSVGVGVFLVVAMLRVIFQIRLSTVLIVSYGIVFVLAAFTSNDFLAIAFDSGGVTTGPMTVPFILALGVGLSSVQGSKSAAADSFGLVALSSVGPILSVLIMGIIYKGTPPSYLPAHELHEGGIILSFLLEAKDVSFDIFIAMLPLAAIFLFFQLRTLRMPRRAFRRVVLGLVYTFLGLTLFLTGVNAGFMPAGQAVGRAVGALSYNWIMIPIGVFLGFCVIFAEPAVRVLNSEVEHVTGGHISRKVMLVALASAVAAGVALGMLRILLKFSIWYYIIPGYLIALVLSKLTPPIFCGIAFDSGGVASGPMTATFILAFAQGAADYIEGANVLTDAFGMVAMVALMPLLAIQTIGMIYDRKVKYGKEAESGGAAG